MTNRAFDMGAILALAAAGFAAPIAPLVAQQAGPQYGASAAVAGDLVLIGEPTRDERPADVHVFRRQGDSFVPAGTLRRPEPGEDRDWFGRFVAVDGADLFVGGSTYEDRGAVWHFRRSGDQWSFVERLAPSGVAEEDAVGRTGVAADGLLFFSAVGNSETGVVWVFSRGPDGRWVEEARLRPGDAGENHFFGWSLAYDAESGRLLVGALTPAAQSRGAAYVFRREAPGQWTREARFDPDRDAPPGLQLGIAVGWHEGRALVGASGADGLAGEVRVYERDDRTGAWSQDVVLTAYDRQGGAQFGASIASGEGEVWVGAPGADGSGRVYRVAFDPVTGRFTSSTKLAGVDAEPGDAFGSVLAVDGGVAIVGQPGDDFQLGSAIVFARSGGGWASRGKFLGPDPTGLAAITGGDVTCATGTAAQFPCKDVSLLSFLPVQDIGGSRGAQTNDIWGWTDPESGREYALVGRTDGTAFIDVSNPNQPVYVGNLPKTPGSRDNMWRDIKVYRNHAYVVADGALEHGMQVFDLTRLRGVRNPPATFEPDVLYDRIASAHNIVINEETGFAYAVGSNSGGQTCGGALHMIDIREPKNPTFAGCFADERTGTAGTGYSHDAMCIVYDGPDREHAGKEICFGSNETAISIADVSDKAHPAPISVADYPNVGYSHQGWITPDHRYFYMNDEGDEMNAAQAGQRLTGTRTLVWDVQDLDDPIMVKEHFGEAATIDHNLYIRDHLMYQSNYVSGLRILDVSDPLSPREVGYIDTVPGFNGIEMEGSWSNYPFFASGTVAVTSMREGVFFVRYAPPIAF